MTKAKPIRKGAGAANPGQFAGSEGTAHAAATGVALPMYMGIADARAREFAAAQSRIEKTVSDARKENAALTLKGMAETVLAKHPDAVALGLTTWYCEDDDRITPHRIRLAEGQWVELGSLTGPLTEQALSLRDSESESYWPDAVQTMEDGTGDSYEINIRAALALKVGPDQPEDDVEYDIAEKATKRANAVISKVWIGTGRPLVSAYTDLRFWAAANELDFDEAIQGADRMVGYEKDDVTDWGNAEPERIRTPPAVLGTKGTSAFHMWRADGAMRSGWTDLTGGPYDEPRAALQDALTDLQHWAESRNLDIEDALNISNGVHNLITEKEAK